jgi:hypothetical protein
MNDAPKVVSGLCYLQAPDGIFYPEDIEETLKVFTRHDRFHIVVANLPD